MRSDMYKLLHETTRPYYGERTQRALREVDGEVLEPTRQSMRRPHRRCWGGKGTTLRLAPLTRFLESRVGQPWDKTFSELQTTLRQRDEAFSELSHYLRVATKTSMQDGEVVVHDRYQGFRAPETAFCDFYVHPVTRLLMRARSSEGQAKRREALKEQRKLETLARRRILDHSRQLHLVDGIWFEVTLGWLPLRKAVAEAQALTWRDPDYLEKMRAIERYDVLLGRRVYHSDGYLLRERYGLETAYAKAKRQLSHRELKAHGLLPTQAH